MARKNLKLDRSGDKGNFDVPSSDTNSLDVTKTAYTGRPERTVRVQCLAGEFTANSNDNDPTVSGYDWLANFDITVITGPIKYKIIVPPRSDGLKYYIKKDDADPILLGPRDTFDENDPSIGIGG